jgi:hypothetical protein
MTARRLRHHLETGDGPVLGRRLEITAIRADGSEILVELAITVRDRPPDRCLTRVTDAGVLLKQGAVDMPDYDFSSDKVRIRLIDKSRIAFRPGEGAGDIGVIRIVHTVP